MDISDTSFCSYTQNIFLHTNHWRRHWEICVLNSQQPQHTVLESVVSVWVRLHLLIMEVMDQSEAGLWFDTAAYQICPNENICRQMKVKCSLKKTQKTTLTLHRVILVACHLSHATHLWKHNHFICSCPCFQRHSWEILLIKTVTNSATISIKPTWILERPSATCSSTVRDNARIGNYAWFWEVLRGVMRP